MPIGAQLTDFIATSTSSGDERDPSVAILADGRIVIVFETADADGTGVWVRILNADGSSAAPDLLVNSVETNDQLSPSVVASTDGGFYVTWSSDTGDGQPEIFVSTFDSIGVPGSTGLQVNIATTDTQQKPDVTGLTNGRILVTWESEDGSDSVNGQYLEADGTTPFGSEFTIFGATANSVSTTALANGRAAVVWHDENSGTRHIYMRIYDADGVEVNATPFEVSSGSVTANQEAVVAELTSGAIVIAWEDPAAGEVYYRLMNPDGTSPTAGGVLANSSSLGIQSSPAVAALADGRFVVVFRTNDGSVDGDGAAIVARLFSADGTPIGSDFLVNTTTLNSPFGGEIDVAAMADGSFVVTWASPDGALADDENIRTRIFDPTQFTGTGANDIYEGGSLGDTISGLGGDDELFGGDGDDVISGDAGTDTMQGGAGNDRIFGSTGNDAAIGGSGRDEIRLGVGDSEIIQVNDGDDAVGELYDFGTGTGQILVVSGSDLAYEIDLRDDSIVGANQLQVSGAGSNIFATGGVGVVRLLASQLTAVQLIFGDNDGTASSTIDVTMYTTNILDLSALNLSPGTFGNGDRFIVNGDANLETITGSATVQNYILGGGGGDLIVGGGLDDHIAGGAGVDNVNGGGGNDFFWVTQAEDGTGENYDGNTGFNRITLANILTETSQALLTVDLRDDVLANINEIDFAHDVAINSTATLRILATQVNGVGFFGGSFNVGDSDTIEITMGGATTLDLSGKGLNDFTQAGDKVVILGDADAETITGSAVIDIITAGGNGDTLAGRNGNDVYNLEGFGATINELAGAGTGADTVTSTTNRTLAGFLNVENLTLLGTAITGEGNASTNTITGNTQNNVLIGAGATADTLIGLAGNDTYVMDATTDIIQEAAGAAGGTADHVHWTGTNAQLYTLAANVELLTLLGAANTNGTGNAGVNTITGNAGANTLNGGVGVDTLIGGNGNDSYVINRLVDGLTTDVVQEVGTIASTADVVRFTGSANAQSYTLGANLEILTLLGTFNTNGVGNTLGNSLTGNTGANTFTGGDGNDVLNGMAGLDTLNGGNGNDTYVINRAIDGATTDVVQETGTVASTADLVQFTGTAAGQLYTLGAGVEKLTLLGAFGTNGTGNTLANTITGNAGDNILDGMTGLDTLRGGNGNDIIIGGAGKDSLFGENNNDTFRFTAVGDSALGPNRDVISDLDDFGNDVIDLSLMAGVNTFIGIAAFTAAGQVRVIQAGANVLVEINTVGVTGAESEILIANATLGAGVGQVDAGDFLL